MQRWSPEVIRYLHTAADRSRYYTDLARELGAFLHPEDRVCDAGCGLGLLSRALLPYCGHVTAIDRSPAAIADLTARGHDPRLTALTGDIRDLPPQRPYDAMVFFTNAENSVTGLTQKQIQDIYVYGKYTNWNQIGGPDAELLPYRRNTDSGSHALMEQYFLEGGKLSLSPDVHNVLTSYAMSSALTDVAGAMTTDPLAYAMGYSVYYYYVNSYWLLGDAGGGELKLLAVDGVLPSDETIADGSYPLAGYNYLVLRAGEPEDAPARRLAEFMVSEAGQTCVGSAGFGPLSSGPQADFQREQPNQSVDAVFPAGPGYVVLSWDEAHTTLRASGLERSGTDGRWHELTANECPAPEPGKLSAARLGSGGGTVIFGAVGGERGDSLTVRLTYGGGQSLTRWAYPGQTFHFLLEGSPALEKLELLQSGQVLDGCTGLS